MKRLFFFLFFFFCITNSCLFSQSKIAKNDLHISLFGDAAIIAFNLERMFPIDSAFFVTVKVGIGAGNKFCYRCSNPYLGFPHHVTANWGKNKNFLEFGLGGISLLGKIQTSYILYPILGFRHRFSKNRKSIFRLFVSYPITTFIKADLSFSIIGISLGTRF